jgi:cytochrome c peroxidase
MRNRYRVVAGAVVTVAFGLAAGFPLLTKDVSGQGPKTQVMKPKKVVKAPQTPQSGGGVIARGVVSGPLPPPVMPPDTVILSDVERLGKFMLYDINLSDPVGYACATCHIPETGFTGPVSIVNQNAGTMPGVVPGRFSNRKPQSYVYASYEPEGPFFNANKGVYVGGGFWDGRVPDNFGQAQQPPINPNEMANISTNGIYPPTAGGFSALLASKLQFRPYTPLFLSIYGLDAFTKYTPQEIYLIFAAEVAAYQATGEVNGFSSKWDASIYGVPPQTLYTLTPSEERGRILYGVGQNPFSDPTYGQAQCFQCHSSAALPNVTQMVNGKEVFTMYCFANIGNPRNLGNPFYQQTNCVSNPHGCNPLGTNYVDFGLGDNPNPAPDGTVFNNPATNGPFLGLFKTPSNRDVDLRPPGFPGFVKAYMHNGVHKSLPQVVHFYNTRNIAVNPATRQQVAFDLRVGPPPGFNRIWGPPEVLANVQNVAGFTPAQAIAAGTTGVIAMNGQVGNLGLTPQQEIDVVNFLKILSDGFTPPNPVFTN